MSDSIEAQAERYRFIRDNLIKITPRMDGQHYFYFRGPCLKTQGCNFDIAMDELIEKTKREKEEYDNYVNNRTKSN